LLGIINDILDFSKIEAKKLDLELLDFNLSAILNDFTAALTVQAAQKGLEIICRTDPDVPVLLRGDPGRLRQILTNLAGNAIKFTHHGCITIHVQLIENIEDDVLLRFGVKDTGIGIPENKMDMIFANFTQADASTTRRYGGTGLGLAISKQLAELMGGRMGVDSEIGKGSEFWFTVRFKKQKASTLEEICHPEAARHDRQAGLMEEDSTTTKADSSNAMNTFVGSNARILVAEDNITNQQVAMGILKKLGLRADAVANGAEVIDAIKNLPYNLILMDVQMPVMDGLEATRRIREMETKRAALSGTTTDSSSKRSYIPIIAMTAHAMQGDREKCLAAGMNDYLSKPVSPQDLVKHLKKWLPNVSPEDEPIAGSIDTKQLPVTESNDTDLPIWNKSKLIERLMDDEELVSVILEGFLSDIPKQILALKGYLESGDTSGTERQAHTIKGASANISAERLRAAAFEVEKAARANNSAAMGMLIQQLETQFDRLKECMQQDKTQDAVSQTEALGNSGLSV
jgi:CheY-like chemotaxis protein